MTKIIAVTNQKGGVGKSTVSFCLAEYLGRLSPTLLIDGDVNKNITKAVERGEFSFDVAEPSEIAEKIEDYSYVIIDTKAQPNDEELKTLANESDLVVLPTLSNVFALEGLTDTTDFLDSIGSENYRVLLSIVAPKPSTKGQQAFEYLDSEKIPVFKARIHRYEVYPESQLAGVPVDKASNRYRAIAWNDVHHLAQEIIKLLDN